MAKGKFYSYFLDVQEGVQGPYRLTGPNNESFIIILVNSEKIFLDGRLLQRGFDYDYIIDYNTAEITFNNTLLITQFSRVRVDFEYAEQNYNRTIIQASQEQRIGRWRSRLVHYQEQDSPNRPIGFELDTNIQKQMAAAGDNPRQMVVNGATATTFEPERILYKQQDTLGQTYLCFFAHRAA